MGSSTTYEELIRHIDRFIAVGNYPDRYQVTKRVEVGDSVSYHFAREGEYLGSVVFSTPRIKVVFGDSDGESGIEAHYTNMQLVEEYMQQHRLWTMWSALKRRLSWMYGIDLTEAIVNLGRAQSDPDNAAQSEQEADVGRPPLSDNAIAERVDVVKDVLAYAEQHAVSQRVACDMHGIPYGTFRDWRAKYYTDE